MIFLAKPHRSLRMALLVAIFCSACSPLVGLAPNPTLSPILPPTSSSPPTLTFTSSSTETPLPTFTPISTDTLTATLSGTPSETATSTLTATITPTPSRTPVPSRTPIPVLPRVSILQLASCRYGPGPGYLFFTGLGATAWEEVVGRMQILSRKADGSWGPAEWLFVQSLNHDPLTRCWVNASLTHVIQGDINTVPDYSSKPKAPDLYGASDLYEQVTSVSAQRDGDFVDVYWQANYMTEDDYRGYMIEAWVCYQSQYYFAPVAFVGSFAQNESEPIDVMSIPDGPGCSQASHGQIFLAEKHGYTKGVIIPWPALPTVPAPTETPSQLP